VADQQQGAAGFAAEAGEFGHHLARHRHIQAGGGFIGDHQRRLQGHRQGDRQALAHAAAEFMRIAAVALWADPHALQQFLRPAPHPAAGPERPVGGERVAEVIADAQQRVEPGHRVLKHQAHRFAPQALQGGAAQTARVLAAEQQLAAGLAARRQQLHHGAGHRAFAAS
jgi:hypothetical protein